MEASSLRGIWGFPVTPFRPDRSIDTSALRAAVDYQVEGGVDVVVAAGSLAEADSLSGSEWATAVATTLEVVAERAPALVAVRPGFGQAAEDARTAADLGADGLLVTLPAAASIEGLAAYVTEIWAVCGLPLVLYDRPPVEPLPSTLGELLRIEGLIGIKDGHRDLRRFRRIRSSVGDRLVLAAAWEDLALPYWAAGADAFCPASTSHDPAYSRRWLRCLREENVAEARQLLDALAEPLTDLRLSRPGISVAVVKAAMRERGLQSGCVRPPSLELTSDEAGAVRTILRRFDSISA